jgi:tetratricopeptide (TPR) repeat protein
MARSSPRCSRSERTQVGTYAGRRAWVWTSAGGCLRSVSLLLLCLIGASHANAQDLTAQKDTYLRLLDRYAAGDTAGAIDGVLRADPRQVREMLASILDGLEAQLVSLRKLSASTKSEAPVAARRNAIRRRRLEILTLSLLVHTEAAVRVRVPHDHLRLASGTSAHRLLLLEDDYVKYGPTADGIAAPARAKAADEEWAHVRATVRDFYLAVIAHLFRVREPNLLRAFIPASLQNFEGDAELLLARGSYWEYEAMTMVVDRSLAREIYLSRVLTLAQQRAGWAADDFERALRSREDQHEARLRLGHALALRGKSKEAADAYAAVTSGNAPVNLRYMAYVFTGDLATEAGNRQAARDAYEAALRLYPSAQRPKLALSAACFDEGDRDCADRWLDRSMSEVAIDRADPWWTYVDGQGWLADARLEALRKRAGRR